MKKNGVICLTLILFSTALYGGGEYEAAGGEPRKSSPGGINTASRENAEMASELREFSDSSPKDGASPNPESLAKQTGAHAGSLLRLAILPFTGTAEGEYIARLLSNDQNIRTAFTVVLPPASSLNLLAAHQNQPYTGLTDTAAAIGKQINADFVIIGHIKKLGDGHLVMMILFKVETLQQIAGSYRRFQEIKEVRGLLPSMVKRILGVVQLDPSPKPALGVLPLTLVHEGINSQDAEVLLQLLTIEIANSGQYMVLSQDITPLGIEIRRPELAGPDAIKAMGKALNVQYLLTGNVTGFGENRNHLLAQIFMTETAALHTGGDLEYRSITDGFQLIPELAFQLTGIPPGGFGPRLPHHLVWVAGGSFSMGSSQGNPDEQPVHTVWVNSFFMGKTPVTQEEYEAVIGKNPSYSKGAKLPVENVSWYDAIEYCNKLSIQEGLTPVYSGSNERIICNFTATGYRLPTEAEWEYAARGGGRDPLTFDYAGGNSLDVLGWYQGNSEKKSHEVEQRQPNSLGLYDMTGNVWEWCWDWYGPYQEEQGQDPSGPPLGKERVNRGGSWTSPAPHLRSTYRSLGNPANAYYDLGFRVLRSIF